jgi:hypothetical protein
MGSISNLKSAHSKSLIAPDHWREKKSSARLRIKPAGFGSPALHFAGATLQASMAEFSPRKAKSTIARCRRFLSLVGRYRVSTPVLPS